MRCCCAIAPVRVPCHLVRNDVMFVRSWQTGHPLWRSADEYRMSHVVVHQFTRDRVVPPPKPPPGAHTFAFRCRLCHCCTCRCRRSNHRVVIDVVTVVTVVVAVHLRRRVACGSCAHHHQRASELRRDPGAEAARAHAPSAGSVGRARVAAPGTGTSMVSSRHRRFAAALPRRCTCRLHWRRGSSRSWRRAAT
jgi:hypothetical protein